MAADYYSDQAGNYGMPDMSNGGYQDWPWPQPNATIANGPNAGQASAQPQMPGYDDQHDPYQGSWQVNDSDGSWYWLPKGSSTTHQGDVVAPLTDTGTGGTASPTNWAGLSQSIFGSMPSVSQYTPPPFSYDQFQAPAPFAPPSANDVLFADPGYQFRLDQGTGAMQNSAAARGVLNTGGTLQDLVDYGQKAGSQEYGNAFNRALGTYQTNYNDALNNYVTNFGNALTKYNVNNNSQFQTPYNQLMQQYGLGMQGQQQLFGQQFQTATA